MEHVCIYISPEQQKKGKQLGPKLDFSVRAAVPQEVRTTDTSEAAPVPRNLSLRELTKAAAPAAPVITKTAVPVAPVTVEDLAEGVDNESVVSRQDIEVYICTYVYYIYCVCICISFGPPSGR